ncbi:ABC transporter permease [Nocardia sp. NPDC059177]|uniref:ABC transporter permease n=1 Tax=Nocardia sp. NPDC059177 TaxID=3346759 RepID=UPI0036B330A1
MRGYLAMVSISWHGSRRQLIAWTLGLAVAFAATAWSLHSLYGTPAEIATYAAATESADTLYVINGKPYGLGNIGGVIVYEFGFVSAIAFPLMGIHLMVRMTRAEEQSGRMELLRAGTIGRTAALAAAFTLTAAALVLIALSMTATLLLLGLGWPGVVLYPLAVVGLGAWFAAVAAVAAQVVAAARTVTASCLALLVVVFLLRGIGDVGDSALVWLSPIGWAEQTRPFAVDARWWPGLLTVGTAALAGAAAARLAQHRDLGAGLFAARRGSAAATAVLLRPVGFAMRRHRGSVVVFTVIGALVGVAFGAVAGTVGDLLRDNATLREVFGTVEANEKAYLAYAVVLLALICAGFAVQGVGRMAEEESADRLEPLLAGSISRTRWLTAQLTVLFAGTVVIALVSGFALGLSDAFAVGDPAATWRYPLATAAYLPAVGVLLCAALALYGLRPAALGLSWTAFIVVTVIATLADTLRLPGWVRQVSPLEWVGRTPAEPVSWWGLAIAACLAAGLALAGFRGLARRDIPARQGAGLIRRVRSVAHRG